VRNHHQQPELLAPAGDFEAMRAAVANGANAVYFGLDHFNARFRATNFERAKLAETMQYLHRHNVRGYVTLNTLIFTNELGELVQILGELVAADVDAIIVQDLGLAELARRVAPNLVVHGSTQMTLTEPRAIEFVGRLGVQRVILARELAIKDIQAITTATTMPVEVFVHGALCVSYSGQCLTSEALGGRSANRGQCAQACRLPYEMVVDGETRDFGERAYLLSPLDLAAPDLIEALLDAGVVSFKIEGRLKTASYVAATSQTYRAALDAAINKQPFTLSRSAEIDLQQSFSRGFASGFLAGINHQQLVPARFPKARGVRVGQVHSANRDELIVCLEPEHEASILKPGDGFVLDEGHPEQDEQGGRVYSVEVLPRSKNARESERIYLRVGLASRAINCETLAPNSILWRTDDPDLHRRMEQTYARDRVIHPEALNWHIHGKIGAVVELQGTDVLRGTTAKATWQGPLEIARKHPLDDAVLAEQLGRLGESPFLLGQIKNELPANCMLPKSVLNDLRRQVVEQLLAARQAGREKIFRPQEFGNLFDMIRAERKLAPIPLPRLSVLVRNEEQLRTVLAWKTPQTSIELEAVYCDWEDVRRYRAAVELAREANRTIGLATLRIMKPGEEGLLSIIARAEPDRILVRNLGSLEYFRESRPELPLHGDFSLNVTNPITASLLIKAGLRRLVPSLDLNWEQLADLLKHGEPSWFEPIVHQHLPMFHNEHCIFAAMLSTGKDWRDCGRPCDHHRVELRDRVGAEFPLVADTGCRNTVFNSVPQSAAEYLPRMIGLGVRHVRIDLLREDAAQTTELLNSYAQVLSGGAPAKNTFKKLAVLSQLGVTRGTLD
jgi:U32 family peptidase